MASTLEIAVKANLPLIAVSTTDTVNMHWVLETLLGTKVLQAPKDAASLLTAVGRVFFTQEAFAIRNDLYTGLAKAKKTLLLINQPAPHPLVFNAGIIPTPRHLQRDLLSQVAAPEILDQLAAACSGMTLKDIGECSTFTMARDKCLSVKGFVYTRGFMTAKIPGLQLVDTTLDGYLPYSPLVEWLTLNKTFFADPTMDYRLVPRGLLLDGPPGVGKSQASKWLANELQVPLYRVDIPSALSKWIGGSEANVESILATADNESPCVLLLDEVEKVFQQDASGDAGVSSRIMSQLLWWLQEHTSRVLSVMTTNNKASLPQELYREGRVDLVLSLPRLDLKDAVVMSATLIKSFGYKPTKGDLNSINQAMSDYINSHGTPGLSPTTVRQITLDLVKKFTWYKKKS